MKLFSKTLLVAAILSAGASVAQAEEIELDAAVGISNLYLFRGADLGDSSPQVWGDLSASYGGAYAGVWGSSGDDTLGTSICRLRCGYW